MTNSFNDVYQKLIVLLNNGETNMAEIISYIQPSYEDVIATTASLIKAGVLSKEDVVSIFSTNKLNTKRK